MPPCCKGEPVARETNSPRRVKGLMGSVGVCVGAYSILCGSDPTVYKARLAGCRNIYRARPIDFIVNRQELSWCRTELVGGSAAI